MAALPIIVAGAAALILLGGKKSSGGKGKSSRRPSRSGCPDVIDIDDQKMNAAFASAEKKIDQIGTDPYKFADIMFSSLFPKGCTKKDYKSNARFLGKSKDLAAIYGNLVITAAGMMMESGFMSGADFKKIENREKQEYKKLTGKSLPAMDG